MYLLPLKELKDEPLLGGFMLWTLIYQKCYQKAKYHQKTVNYQKTGTTNQPK